MFDIAKVENLTFRFAQNLILKNIIVVVVVKCLNIYLKKKLK